MGKDTEMVALDSSAMTKLIEALTCISAPSVGADVEARKALARGFFYLPPNCCFHLTPTVQIEYLRINSEDRLRDHLSWANSHFCFVNPTPDPKWVEKRAAELNQLHSNAKDLDDCKVLAECEASMIKCLISDDKKFIKKLRYHSPSVSLCPPRNIGNR